jgi:hypothetical protein
MNESEFLQELSEKKPITYKNREGYIATCKFKEDGDILKLRCILRDNTKSPFDYIGTVLDAVEDIISSSKSETETRERFNEIGMSYGSNNLVEVVESLGLL